MNDQLDFSSLPVAPWPRGHVGPAGGTIEDNFWAFHKKNPHVYHELVRLSRRWQSRGKAKCGIGMLFEVLRWRSGMRTGGDDFKLNNNYRALYARLIMLQEPDLADFFELRELNA